MTEARFSHGLVLGKFYPLHAGHSSLIRTALRACDKVTVEVLASSVESIPLDTRMAWVREEHPTAHVVGAIDDAPVDYDSDAAWAVHLKVIEGLLDGPVDAVFTSDAYGEELARRLGATWVQVDPGRAEQPVSGTAIRADIAAHWHELAPAVRASLAARVVVLGAESTGSTTLAAALAQRLATDWVPEYGSDYVMGRPGGLEAQWHHAEFLHIGHVQTERESRALRTTPKPVLVCDTDVFATALWHERYLGMASAELLAAADAYRPALYILTGDEIPWVQDGSRDGEHIRHQMQQNFRKSLTGWGVPWIEVTGSVEDRIAQSLPAIHLAAASHLTYAAPMG